MKHYTVFYIETAAGVFRFYASVCETHGKTLIEHITNDLTRRHIPFKTQCHWDCDTANRDYDGD